MADLHSTRLARVASLHIYPVKSCAGITVQRARLSATGFEHDRQWMIVHPDGRFVTQREQPRLAVVRPQVSDTGLTLHTSGMDPCKVEGAQKRVEVQCWRDRCSAFDEGEAPARWLTALLGRPYRLVRFDPAFERPSDQTWTGEVKALNQFSDGFPWLLISQASLDALNARLEHPLPMNRFRPNIVISGLGPFEEDELEGLETDTITLRPVKPSTRCVVTTTNQLTGERDGEEPLRTLRTFRFDRDLRGVRFGQNAILLRGIGEWLEVGQALRAEYRAAP